MVVAKMYLSLLGGVIGRLAFILCCLGRCTPSFHVLQFPRHLTRSTGSTKMHSEAIIDERALYDKIRTIIQFEMMITKNDKRFSFLWLFYLKAHFNHVNSWTMEQCIFHRVLPWLSLEFETVNICFIIPLIINFVIFKSPFLSVINKAFRHVNARRS